jgi:hypothetical protein
MAETYPITRLLLRPEYRAMSPERIEDVLVSAFPDMAPEDAEDFLRSLGHAFRNVGQTVAQRAPGILGGAVQGAGTGAALGPLGALGGALVGGTVGGVTHGQPGAAAPRPPAPAAAPSPSPTLGQVPAAAPSPIVKEILALLAQPQTFQAFLAAAMGGAGRPTLPAGQTAVSTASVLGALGTLATRAAEELGGAEGGAVSQYLISAEGDYAVDPADPDARARRLLGVLAHANEHLLGYDENWEYDEDFEEDEAYGYDEYAGSYAYVRADYDEYDDDPGGDDGGDDWDDGGYDEPAPAPWPYRRSASPRLRVIRPARRRSRRRSQ